MIKHSDEFYAGAKEEARLRDENLSPEVISLRDCIEIIARAHKDWDDAYTLGYLLRKLPRTLHETGYWLYIESQPTQYAAYYCDPSHQLYFVANNVYRAREHADTPENAVTKLAVELFKQGVLVKEPHE